MGIKEYLRKVRQYLQYYRNCLYFRAHAFCCEELVIYIQYPGLGDHLFYSHLPRLIKESGRYSRVYISSLNKYRSNDIKRVVWDLNPFVDGYVAKKAPSCTMNVKVNDKNLLAVIAYMYGIDIEYADPEIFYEPKMITDLKGATLYDPNYISNAGEISAVMIEKYFNDKHISISHQLAPREKSMMMVGPQELTATSIFDFIDILFSVNEIYCLTTGTATICSAISKKAYVLYGIGIIPMHHHSKYNDYIFLEKD